VARVFKGIRANRALDIRFLRHTTSATTVHPPCCLPWRCCSISEAIITQQCLWCVGESRQMMLSRSLSNPASSLVHQIDR
jgi:hypothetical protein